MQKAEKILKAIRKLGEKGVTLDRIYRNLYEPELYLVAYGRLYSNEGALTPGTTDETVDGMSLRTIQTIINSLKEEKYNFSPARRTYIPKSNGMRPLGLPTFTDKMVQEVVRMILEAYYEPRFSPHSHGFRPGRGCHTALREIKKSFTGAVWYVEMDIRGCFDTISHERLLEILRENISDGRFLNLIRRMLKAGYMEEWQYHKSYSGTPQGGVVSPLLSNIYLDVLDRYVAETLIPEFTEGKTRAASKEYAKVYRQVCKARAKGNKDAAEKWRKVMRQMPSGETHDPNFKRLRYVRYADDALLAVIGSKEDAKEVKRKLAQFLQENLKLDMSEEKTHITHARSSSARFLGYWVSTYQKNERLTRDKLKGTKTRSLNGQQRLSIPQDKIDGYCKRYMRQGKSRAMGSRLNNSVAEIITSYQSEFRGIAEYYKYASNRANLSKLKNVMQESLVKTLAQNLKIKTRKVYQRFRATVDIGGEPYTVLKETVTTDEGKTYEFIWGGVSLKVAKFEGTHIVDQLPTPIHLSRTELVRRLTANKCEQCESTQDIEVHHVRKLKDLSKRWRNREAPTWVKFMIARRRKTIILCRKCHLDIHKELRSEMGKRLAMRSKNIK